MTRSAEEALERAVTELNNAHIPVPPIDGKNALNVVITVLINSNRCPPNLREEDIWLCDFEGEECRNCWMTYCREDL